MSEKPFVKWKLEEIQPRIFHLQFDNHYDVSMHFLRYQENYESPEWKNKIFTILEFMEWYAKNECKWETDKGKKKERVQMFSYPGDWGGFNVPCYVFDRLTRDDIPDFNEYDKFMQSIVDSIRSMGHSRFYLIGTKKDTDSTCIVDHEVSHGLFYTNRHYRDDALALYHDTDERVRDLLKDWMLKSGYCEEVIIDETIAYLATGLPDKLVVNKLCKKAMAPYKALFKETVA